MNWDILIGVSRLALAALGLVFVGRMLRTARIYLSWRAFLFYGAAWLAFPVICVLRLRLFGVPDQVVVRQVFETLFFMGVAGSLLEHVRADRRRYADSRRLMEQWRHASGLSRKRANELEVLSDVTARLVSSLDLRQVLQTVVDHVLRLAGADAVAVYLIDGGTGRLIGPGVTAASGGRPVDLPMPRPEGLSARVASEGAAAFVDETTQHPLFQDAARRELGALAVVPLKLEGAVVGVLNVVFRRSHVFDDDDRRMLLALADVSALAIRNATHHERLARLAVTDDLTGLPNRRRFLEALRTEAQRARRYQRPLALLLLDLDGLKRVNDGHGHAAGDAVLRGVAQALRASTRDTDLPARLSGDEFAVLLPETEPEAAARIAERIRAAVAAFKAAVPGGPVGTTVSLGLATAEGAALPDLPRFLRQADEALYQAKAAGRNTLVAAAASAASKPGNGKTVPERRLA